MWCRWYKQKVTISTYPYKSLGRDLTNYSQWADTSKHLSSPCQEKIWGTWKISRWKKSSSPSDGSVRLNCGNDSLHLKCTSSCERLRTHKHSNLNCCYRQPDHKVTEPVMMSLRPCVSFPFSIMRDCALVGSQIRIVTDYVSSVHLIQVSWLMHQFAPLFFPHIWNQRNYCWWRRWKSTWIAQIGKCWNKLHLTTNRYNQSQGSCVQPS